MSLNHLTTFENDNKFLNIKCNTMSFGIGQLKTQADVPNFNIGGNQNILVSSSPVFYTCDDTSARLKAELIYTSGITPQSQFFLYMNIPGELLPSFNTGVLSVLGSGYIVEAYPEATNINSGFVNRVVVVGNTLEVDLVYRTVQSSNVNFKIVLDICIFKQE